MFIVQDQQVLKLEVEIGQSVTHKRKRGGHNEPEGHRVTQVEGPPGDIHIDHNDQVYHQYGNVLNFQGGFTPCDFIYKENVNQVLFYCHQGTVRFEDYQVQCSQPIDCFTIFDHYVVSLNPLCFNRNQNSLQFPIFGDYLFSGGGFLYVVCGSDVLKIQLENKILSVEIIRTKIKFGQPCFATDNFMVIKSSSETLVANLNFEVQQTIADSFPKKILNDVFIFGYHGSFKVGGSVESLKASEIFDDNFN